MACARMEITYPIEEVVAVPIPRVEQLDATAFSLGPAVTIGKWRKQRKGSNGENKEEHSGSLVYNGIILGTNARNANRQEVKQLTKSDDGKVQSREIVMKEKLTSHEEEGEVVESPAQNRSPQLIVKSLDKRTGIVIAASLPSQNGNDLEQSPKDNSNGRGPPNHRIADEVDLGVVLAPEVDSTSQDRPCLGTRIPCVRFGQASIRCPHDSVKLEELAQETRVTVVDLFGGIAELRMLVVLNVPQAVGHTAATSTSDLLLLRGPLRELDFVREQHTARHDVNKAEFSLNRSQSFLGDTTERLLLYNFNAEQIIGIAFKALISVSGDLLLPIDVRDRGSHIVRVKTAMGRLVEQTDQVSIADESRTISEVIPCRSAIDRRAVDAEGLRLVLQEPHVIHILVRIQCNLLLLASSGIHERVRV